MKYIKIIGVAFCFLVGGALKAQTPHSQGMAATAMHMWKDSFALGNGPAKWSYDMGVILKGIEGIWLATGQRQYFDYLQRQIDFFVKEDGSLQRYKPDEYNIDHINNGKLVLTLYRVTGRAKYKKAADLLRSQLLTHPRTQEGGFWHKKIYPYQMWLDGLYMAQPFYAEYAATFGEDTIFNDITKQFVLMERHARDAKTGLLLHGYDESRQQQWADKITGRSPNVWARALGWFGMAMVDALDYFPAQHPGRDSIIAILNRFATAVTAYQDKASGLWYDVVDKPQEPRNYKEASASCMLVYTLAKGVRKGYLPASFIKFARQGYEGITSTFLQPNAQGSIDLKGTVAVSGLGGKPYRDGSFAYYMSEPVIVNDPKGMGAFIKAAVEMEMLPTLIKGNGVTLVLDNYFNNEYRKDANGRMEPFHYTWDDRTHSGFNVVGAVANSYGIKTTTLKQAPTAANLAGAQIYLIVDPDTEKETAHPNFMTEEHAGNIAAWVKKGGVLVVLGNDSGNAELQKINLLTQKFGIRMNEDSRNQVKNDNYPDGTVMALPGNPLLPKARKLYIKEYCSLSLSGNATPLLTHQGTVVAATAKYGKGNVLVIGDPWLYNEYVDGRKLPADFDNYQAIHDIMQWLLKKVRK